MHFGAVINPAPEPALYMVYGMILVLLSALVRRMMPKPDAKEEKGYGVHVRIRSRKVVSINRGAASPKRELAMRRASNY